MKKAHFLIRYCTYFLITLTTIYDITKGEFYSFFLWNLVTIYCAWKCSDWARKTGKNQNIAFVSGLFGLIGLATYYLYYRMNLKELGALKEE